mmetsp:Transcript_6215/g.11829  ORF Transcript_6215/g.11829 Transcript_6215/m.11829 type:complete len:1115 (+) Transcript_6215:301-3645(+)
MTVFCNLSSSPSLNAKAASNKKFSPKPMQHDKNESQADRSSTTNGSVDSNNQRISSTKKHSNSGTPRSMDTNSTCSVTMATVGSPDDKEDSRSAGGSLAPVDLTKRVGSILSRSSSDGSASSNGGGGGKKNKAKSNNNPADLSMPTLQAKKPKQLFPRQNSEATHQVTNIQTDVLPPYRRQASLPSSSPSTTSRKYRPTAGKATTTLGSSKFSSISAPVTVIKSIIQSSPSHVGDMDADAGDDGYRGDDDNTTVSTLGTPIGTSNGRKDGAASVGNGSPLAAATAAAASARALLAAKRRDALLGEEGGKREQNSGTSTPTNARDAVEKAANTSVGRNSRRSSTATSHSSSGEEVDSMAVLTPPTATSYADDGEGDEEEDFSVYDMDGDDSVLDDILGDGDDLDKHALSGTDINEENEEKEEHASAAVSLRDDSKLLPTKSSEVNDDVGDSHVGGQPGNQEPLEDMEVEAMEKSSSDNDTTPSNNDRVLKPALKGDISLVRGWTGPKQKVVPPTEQDEEEEVDPIQEGREEVESVLSSGSNIILCSTASDASPPTSPRRVAVEDEISLLRGWATPRPTVAPTREEEEEEESDPIEQGREDIESVLSASSVILCSAAPDASTKGSNSPPASIETSEEEALSRAVTELSDEIDNGTAASTAASATSTAKTIKKAVDTDSAGLPLLYLGPIDIKRPERYASLGHCVHEALRVNYRRCAVNALTDVVILYGPASSVRHDQGDNVWIASVPSRGIDQTIAGRSGASVSSSQRSWAPVDVDSGTNEISSLSDVRRAHSGVAAALASGQPEEALSLLDDLLSCLEHQDREQQLEWLTGTGDGSVQHVNELNYRSLIQSTRKNLSVVQIYARQYSSAARNLRDIVRACPEDITSHMQLGLALIGANQLEDSAAVFGDILIKLDKLDTAEETVQGIDGLSQAKGVVLNNLGCCFLKRKEFERARSVLQRALATLLSSEDSSDHTAKIALCLCNLAKTLVQTKEFDTALDTLDTAITYIRDTPHMEEHYLISTMKAKALVAASVKQFMEAIKIYEEMVVILERSENDDEILSVMANMKAIASELSKHTPSSGATYLRMVEARENEVKARKEARSRISALELDLLT